MKKKKEYEKKKKNMKNKLKNEESQKEWYRLADMEDVINASGAKIISAKRFYCCKKVGGETIGKRSYILLLQHPSQQWRAVASTCDLFSTKCDLLRKFVGLGSS
ncbi:hypothetical protein BSKO_08990 [Bryopsis sp. KO-2023]|nr:hypothetical protein BSKO_08990 [Bryopsis sp. KO-2023]